MIVRDDQVGRRRTEQLRRRVAGELDETGKRAEHEYTGHQCDDGGKPNARERDSHAMRNRHQQRADQEAGEKAAIARLAPASMANQCAAWASMPAATGQPIIRHGIEK